MYKSLLEDNYLSR